MFYTLQTAIDQKSVNYEIIVSDNFSNDNTKEVVDSFDDERIRYVNTGKRLSMSDNWEFAVSYARGSYIIIIGDDDGVMPGAIDRLQEYILNFPSDAYCWPITHYWWPIKDTPSHVTYYKYDGEPTQINLKRLVNFSIKWGSWRYGSIPLLYHSVITKKVLDKIKIQTGRVFHTTTPDVFMAFALPVFVDNAIRLGEAITIGGSSAKSNSADVMVKQGYQEGNKFFKEYVGYELHSSLLPDVPVHVNVHADAPLVAMDMFESYYHGMEYNYEAMWAHTQRIIGFDSIIGIIKKRKLIRQYHSFNVKKFLLYSFVHMIMKFRIIIRNKSSLNKFENNTASFPQNIRSCVLYLDEIRKKT